MIAIISIFPSEDMLSRTQLAANDSVLVPEFYLSILVA